MYTILWAKDKDNNMYHEVKTTRVDPGIQWVVHDDGSVTIYTIS